MIGTKITSEQPGYAEAAAWCTSNGAFIEQVGDDLYEVKSVPAPTPEELKAQQIATIKAQLAELDSKRIRPLAEGDVEYLATLNAQAVALRAELQALQGV